MLMFCIFFAHLKFMIVKYLFVLMECKMKKSNILKYAISFLIIFGLAGCDDSSSDSTDDSTTTVVDTDTDTVVEDDTDTDDVIEDEDEVVEDDTYADDDTSPWIINNSTLSTYIYEDTLTSGVVEDAQTVETVTIDDVEYTKVEATDIPKYNVVITQDMVDALNDRPNANDDFTSGETTAVVGETYEFGQDIGYVEDTEESQNCIVTGGIGYWPPGPACPTEQEVEAYFPVSPVDTDEECATGANSIGLLVNGAAIFNWGDTFTYATSTWYNVAPVAEQYDVDICNGHSANGAYHHHSYTSCIATLVDDEADGHSPIYGYSADGYPLYGPYESDGVLAISGWVKRDYSLTNAEGGCNSTDGERTCVLVDEYDVSQGTTDLDSSEYGPDVGVEVETLSGNLIAADEGYYYEDYYYAQNTVTGEQLDEHNGHDTGDGKGYHYHTTLAYDDEGTLTGSFPYHMGPTFKAELPDSDYALATCDSDDSDIEMDNGPGGR